MERKKRVVPGGGLVGSGDKLLRKSFSWKWTERYARWCKRSAVQIMGSLLLDLFACKIFLIGYANNPDHFVLISTNYSRFLQTNFENRATKFDFSKLYSKLEQLFLDFCKLFAEIQRRFYPKKIEITFTPAQITVIMVVYQQAAKEHRHVFQTHKPSRVSSRIDRFLHGRSVFSAVYAAGRTAGRDRLYNRA